MDTLTKSMNSLPTLFAVAFVIFISGCISQSQPPTQTGIVSTSEENVTINLAYAGAPLEAVTYIANDYGFFEKEGVDVVLHQVIPTLALPGLIAGEYQISMFASPNLVAFMARDSPIVLIAHGLYIPANPKGITMDGLIVRKGLEMKSPQDLKGKIVGTPAFGSVIDIHFKHFLRINNIDIKDFEYLEVPPPQAGALLQAGKLDVYMGIQPLIVNLVSQGVVDVYRYNDWVPQNHFSSTYTTSKKFLEKHPETLGRFVRALQNAAVFMKENPDAYYETVAKYTRVNATLLQQFPIPVPVGSDKLSINLEVLEETQNIQLQSGFLDKKVDFSKYLDARFAGIIQ